MNSSRVGRLRPDVIFEPLWNQWYAWSYLIPPATASRYLVHSQLPVMESFVEAPQVHVDTLKDPSMIGGPFIQYPVDRAAEIKSLVDATRATRQPLLALDEAITRLDNLLDQHPTGDSLEPLYQQLPEALRGYVELVYDARDCPSIRYIEPLLYRSDYFSTDSHSIGLRPLQDVDRRAFVLSTPRLEKELACHLHLPFDDPRIDALAALRDAPGSIAQLAERLDLGAADQAAFFDLFTDSAPPSPQDYLGDDVRVRYLGHACVLVESRDTTVLVDPLLGYENPAGVSRHSYADLPSRIDYVLITHNHQDHVMFETLLQLRHKIGTVVIARGQKGSLLDPSLRLILQQIGFRDVREIDELESISIEGGQIIGLPVLGEHGDLNIATKTAYWIELNGRTVLCAADSNNLDNRLYDNLHHLLGGPDILFIGMECDGAPYNWSYGPLLPATVAHRQAQQRRLDGSDAQRALRLIDTLKPKQVYVYAMGMEPWLNFITSLDYSADSRPMVESNKLVHACRERGLVSDRMMGCRDFMLPSKPRREVAAARRLPLPDSIYRVPAAKPVQPAPRRQAAGSETGNDKDRDEAALTAFLQQLGEADIRLWLDGEQLRCSAPKGALTSELTQDLKQYKPRIVALLKGSRDETGTPGSHDRDGDATHWREDLTLDPDIRPPQGNSHPLPPAQVVLTGATGFLGAYLLQELLKQTEAVIHCLVRAQSPNHAMQRIRAGLDAYGLEVEAGDRITAICSDLAQPQLGLDDATFERLGNTADLILHNGAWVHHGLPYLRLRETNVEGTRRVLGLACRGNVPLHYVSTLSVLPAAATTERSRFLETDSLSEYPAPQGGYNLTKWVAERLVAEAGARGLPVTVYRPGPVSGDSRTGAFNPNDFLCRLMSGYLQSGLAPDGATLLDLLPIDFIARAVVRLSMQPAAAGETYHLLHPSPVSSDILFDVCSAAGYRIERIAYDDWFQHLSSIARGDDGHALFPLVALFSSRRGQRGEALPVTELPFDTTRTMAALQANGLQPPALDRALFNTYLSAMLDATEKSALAPGKTA